MYHYTRWIVPRYIYPETRHIRPAVTVYCLNSSSNNTWGIPTTVVSCCWRISLYLRPATKTIAASRRQSKWALMRAKCRQKDDLVRLLDRSCDSDSIHCSLFTGCRRSPILVILHKNQLTCVSKSLSNNCCSNRCASSKLFCFCNFNASR